MWIQSGQINQKCVSRDHHEIVYTECRQAPKIHQVLKKSNKVHTRAMASIQDTEVMGKRYHHNHREMAGAIFNLFSPDLVDESSVWYVKFNISG